MENNTTFKNRIFLTNFNSQSIKFVACFLVAGLLMMLNLSGYAQRNNRLNENRLYLENDKLKASFSEEAPVIFEYFDKSANTAISASGSEPDITFYEGATNIIWRFSKTTWTCAPGNDEIKYHVLTEYKDEPAIEFDLTYSLSDNNLIIEFDNVTEHGNYHLINVTLPGLVTVNDNSSRAKLAIPAGSGRLIDVTESNSGSYEYDINWLNAILAGMVYDSKIMGIVDTESIENHTIASVSERNGIKYGSLGMKLIHRLPNYDLEEFGQIIPVEDPKYLLKVQESCKVTVSILGDYDKDGNISWVDGTKFIRDKIEVKSDPYYADKSVIKWFLDWPGAGRYTTFDEVLESVKAFANQTGAPDRVIYIVGWQYSGHDSGYPSVDKVNQRLGGYSDLEKLATEARKYNTVISFHDNYDDAYMGNPGWDPDIICIDSRGDLMKGGAWDGGQSYLISSHKYAQKSALDRIQKTLKQYPFIKETYHLDVLAGGYNNGRDYDFDPENPSGAAKNFEGKKKIIGEFNKHGVDVTTEDFTGFFVGHVGFFLKIIDVDKAYFRNEEKIPLIPFIYHSKTNYGMRMRGDRGFLQRLIYGENMGANNAGDYILDALPRHLMYGKAMDKFFKDGEIQRVTYKDGSFVEVDYANLKYTVSLNDRVIARDFTSFIPVSDNTYFAGSRYGGNLSYKAPEKWAGENKITVNQMNADGSSVKIPFRLTSGNIEIYTEPEVIYKVSYSD